MEQQRRGYAEDFSFMCDAPIIFISAQTCYNVNKLMQLIRDVDVYKRQGQKDQGQERQQHRLDGQNGCLLYTSQQGGRLCP